MISTKTLLNVGVFIFVLIRPQVHAVMLKYEEPFPPRLPVHVKSRVAFTQYANVPMLSLEEIKTGFPWLKMSAESEADRESMRRSTESGPRYIFYYVPTEVELRSQRNAMSYPAYENAKPEPERGNSFREQSKNHRFEVNPNKPGTSPKEMSKKSKQISKRKKANEKFVNLNTDEISLMKSEDSSLEEKRNYQRHRDRDSDDQRGTGSESKIRTSKDKVSMTLPKNHKFSDRDLPVRSKLSKVAETKTLGDYFYPRTPSRYMQPPQLKFEEKEFWVKNKRKSKRPVKESDRDEERLKNHRIVKHKKSKRVNTENEKRLQNHRPAYDREHDPEERDESSSGKIERQVRKRPKETPKNPLLLSQDGDRLQFHIHGHEGPQTYIFGYDTGDGENRHFRLEERLRDGSVKGHYGYYDSHGKLKMVEYKARPMGGYEEKHHVSGTQDTEEENNGVTQS